MTHTAVFLSQPGPRHILSPAGMQFQLDCSVTPGNNGIQWSVFLPDKTTALLTDTGNTVEILMQRGIIVLGVGTQSSAFVFTGRESNSPAVVRCIAVNTDDSTDRITGEPVNVTIYGK